MCACAVRPSAPPLARESHLASGCYQGWWWGRAGHPRLQYCVLVQATRPAFACPSTIQILHTPPSSVVAMFGAAQKTHKHLIQYLIEVSTDPSVVYKCAACCKQNKTILHSNCCHSFINFFTRSKVEMIALYLHGRESMVLLLAIPLGEACWPERLQRSNACKTQHRCQRRHQATVD